MPADRDGGRLGPQPGVVTDATGDVGFLDGVGLDPTTLADAVRDAFGTLTVGAVLAVYCVRATATELCARDDLELIGEIPHSQGGTTYTIRQRPVASEEHPLRR